MRCAWEIISWNDSSRADSQSSAKMPARPPNNVRRLPIIVSGKERVRTVSPRTMPKHLTTRAPGSSNVVVVSNLWLSQGACVIQRLHQERGFCVRLGVLGWDD